jgi:hypothetical protein
MYCHWYVMYRYSLLCSYCSIVYFYLYIVSSLALLSSSVCRAFAPVPKRPFQVALGVPPFTFTLLASHMFLIQLPNAQKSKNNYWLVM